MHIFTQLISYNSIASGVLGFRDCTFNLLRLVCSIHTCHMHNLQVYSIQIWLYICVYIIYKPAGPRMHLSWYQSPTKSQTQKLKLKPELKLSWGAPCNLHTLLLLWHDSPATMPHKGDGGECRGAVIYTINTMPWESTRN